MKFHVYRAISFCAISLVILLFPFAAHAQDLYQEELSPLLQQYCGSCHASRGRGGVNFPARGVDGDFVRDPSFWKRTINVLEDRSMPENAQRLNFTEVERQRMVMLIRQCLRNPDLSKIGKDPGPFRLRTLTQYEYACTIRDLLGVQDLPKNKLPGDNFSPGISAQSDSSSLSTFMLSRYMNVAEDILDALPRERVVMFEPSDTISKREAARQSLQLIQNRAFRRPAGDEDMDRLMKLFDEVELLGRPYEETLKITLTGVLASPKFITHVEQPKRGDGPQRIDEYDLASRLSYFIWSSMPDEQLIELAGQGKLSEPATIKQQVLRMLADPKARALGENFGMQWLGLHNLRIRTSTTKATSQSTQTITQAQLDVMRDQSLRFLNSVFLQDRSLLSFLDDNQNGVLGLGAVHVATSAGERTSPPRRGRWVLETLLGERVSPGLYNSCRIVTDIKGPEGPALRNLLATARTQAGCAVCHDRIDPPGLLMERFDAFGGENNQDGDITPLKQTILSRKDEFIRALVERMLGYALGRPIEPYDQPTVRQICDALARQDYRSSVLILEIAQSFPFNYRRPPDN